MKNEILFLKTTYHGTAFAMATSPASYWAPKNPHVFMGGFFGARTKCGRGVVEAGVLFSFSVNSYFSAENTGQRCASPPRRA
jgi:hypothetical protein